MGGRTRPERMDQGERGEMMNKPFKVRDFGNDREFDSIESLYEGLLYHYTNRHVAIHTLAADTGMVLIDCVHVGSDGCVRSDYGSDKGKPVDFDYLAKRAGLAPGQDRTRRSA